MQALDRMYSSAGLVHGDLSEFNMLWSTSTSTSSRTSTSVASAPVPEEAAAAPVECGTRTGRIYVIDVSQAVDYCHPLAWNFLLRDCQHVIAVRTAHNALRLSQLFTAVLV